MTERVERLRAIAKRAEAKQCNGPDVIAAARALPVLLRLYDAAKKVAESHPFDGPDDCSCHAVLRSALRELEREGE